jgi:hypothetical protein
MLMVRHAIGSRLFLQTEDYSVIPEGENWVIIAAAKNEELENLMAFKDELNLFVVGEHEKTWYYSSDASIKIVDSDKVQVTADHKTVYPV